MKYNDFYWANDASLQFMYPDYLDQNETPQTRVRDIANNAESILDINGFADKFYNYMAKGYYSLSTPIWKNFGKVNGSPISCFFLCFVVFWCCKPVSYCNDKIIVFRICCPYYEYIFKIEHHCVFYCFFF